MSLLRQNSSTGQDTVQQAALWSRQSITVQLPVLFLTLAFVTIIRRRYFSPLSHIPGPFLASFSRLWHMRYIIRGDQQVVIAKAHEKYGPFVRIAHDEVSVCHENAVKSMFITPLHKVSLVFFFFFNGPISRYKEGICGNKKLTFKEYLVQNICVARLSNAGPAGDQGPERKAQIEH
jgi:hypothetical protein